MSHWMENSTTFAEKGYAKKINYQQGLIIELEIWDTYENMMSLSSLFTREAKGWFIIWDISDPDTFSEIDDWANAIRGKTDFIDFQIPIYLIANKIDLWSGKFNIIINIEEEIKKAMVTLK